MIGAAHGGTFPALGIDAQLEVETLASEHPEAVPSRYSRPISEVPKASFGVPIKILRLPGGRAGYGPRSGMGPVVLPRLGLRGDVLHLRELLPGAGLLRGGVPPPDETPADAACQPETPGQPGRTARSPGPATGLPGKVPPARDGSHFRPPPPIRQHQKTMEKTAKKAALWAGISASAGIEAAPSRHPVRLHRVWAHAVVIGPEREGP